MSAQTYDRLANTSTQFEIVYRMSSRDYPITANQKQSHTFASLSMQISPSTGHYPLGRHNFRPNWHS